MKTEEKLAFYLGKVSTFKKVKYFMLSEEYHFLLKRLQELQADTATELMAKFASAFVWRRYKKGEIISPEGICAREVFFVNKGCVRLFYRRDGKEITAAFAFEGAFTGPCKSMMLQTLNRQIFEAAEDCELMMLSRANYFKVLTEEPRLHKIKSVIAERILFDQEDIISFFLSYTPQERYLYLCNHQPQLFQRVPQHFIASMIGISAVSLSRIRRRLSILTSIS